MKKAMLNRTFPYSFRVYRNKKIFGAAFINFPKKFEFVTYDTFHGGGVPYFCIKKFEQPITKKQLI